MVDRGNYAISNFFKLQIVSLDIKNKGNALQSATTETPILLSLNNSSKSNASKIQTRK